MSISIVFETHSISEDNDLGVASGWNPSRLAARGRQLAAEMGARHRDDGVVAVFSSDLRRAVETTEIAFAETGVSILLDWRLRECDYGSSNGMPSEEHQRDRARHIDLPYPEGESWRQATARVARFLDDLPLRWDNTRVLIVGHSATRWALDHYLNGVALHRLATEEFAWQEGWEYELDV